MNILRDITSLRLTYLWIFNMVFNKLQAMAPANQKYFFKILLN